MERCKYCGSRERASTEFGPLCYGCGAAWEYIPAGPYRGGPCAEPAGVGHEDERLVRLIATDPVVRAVAETARRAGWTHQQMLTELVLVLASERERYRAELVRVLEQSAVPLVFKL